MNRIESAAMRMVPDNSGPVRPLDPATSETPIATFMVFAAAFTIAWAVAHALGPSSQAEAAALRANVSSLGDLGGVDLLKARRTAVSL